MNHKIPKAICGSPDRPLRIGTMEIPCYVLEDGRRVLSGRGMQTALSLGQRHGAQLGKFLSQKNLKPLINNELAMALSTPIRFIRPGRGGKLAVGYEATILADICDFVLGAREKGILTGRQIDVARQCEILTRAFAKIGIIALVDEATGYQEIRDRDELHKILEAYVNKELLPWAKRFPDDYYREMFRLRGWQYHPLSVARPILVGKLTNALIYDRLPPGVKDELQAKNPIDERTKRRRHKYFQFLTTDIGIPHLDKLLAVTVAFMKASPNWNVFMRLFNRAIPKPGSQKELNFDENELN